MILNARGKPFIDKDAAVEKARGLSEELGEEYVVIPHENGFGVVQKKYPAKQRPVFGNDTAPISNNLQESVTTEVPIPGDSASIERAPSVIRLRPAWRSFWKQHFITLWGAAISVSAKAVLVFFTVLLNVDYSNIDFLDQHHVFPFLSLVGICVVVVSIINTVFCYYSRLYLIKETTIESRIGIIQRKIASIEYLHIRSVDVVQTISDRLLNIGRVDFSTANTAGIEVTFTGIAAPMRIQEEVRRRKNALERHYSVVVRGQHDD